MPKRKSTRRNKGKSHMQSLDTYRRCQESLILEPKISAKATTASHHLTTGQKAFMSVLVLSALMMPIIEATPELQKPPKMPTRPEPSGTKPTIDGRGFGFDRTDSNSKSSYRHDPFKDGHSFRYQHGKDKSSNAYVEARTSENSHGQRTNTFETGFTINFGN